MYELLIEQLGLMQIYPETLSELSVKEKEAVYRLKSGGKSYIFKVYKDRKNEKVDSLQDEDKPLMSDNTEILSGLGFRTPETIQKNACAVLIEDIESDSNYRKIQGKYLNDKKVCAQLGKLYKNLHEKGKVYAAEHSDELYSDFNLVSLEIVSSIKKKSGSENNPAWVLIEENFETLKLIVSRADKTLVLNEIETDNFFVSDDKSEFVLRSCDNLGCGLAVSDIGKILPLIGKRGQKAFLKAYGEYDKTWELLSLFLNDLHSLHIACENNTSPSIQNNALKRLRSGEFYMTAKQLLTPEIKLPRNFFGDIING